MKKIIEVVIIIIILLLCIMNYPFKIKVIDGETHCYSLIGNETNCREPSYP
jgi:hypothetical protein